MSFSLEMSCLVYWCGEGSGSEGGSTMDAWVSDCSWLVPYLDVEGMISIIGDMSPWPKEWCPTVCGVLLAGVVC